MGAFLPSSLPFLKINEVSLSPHTAFSGARTHHTFPYIRKKRGWMHKISAPATQIERRGRRDFSFLFPFPAYPTFSPQKFPKKKNPGKCIFLSLPARGSVGEMGVSDLLFPNFIGGEEGRRSASNRISSAEKVGRKKKKFCAPLRRPRSSAIGKNLKSSRQESEGGSIKFPAKNKGGRFHFSLPGKYFQQNKKWNTKYLFYPTNSQLGLVFPNLQQLQSQRFSFTYFFKKRKHLRNSNRHIFPHNFYLYVIIC